METSFTYTEKDRGHFCSNERKYINKIHKLQKQHPDQVQIVQEPEANDGMIYCIIPPAWLKISPPRVLSEEHKAKLMSASTPFKRECSETGD